LTERRRAIWIFSTLNSLLEGGFITFEQYIERIPDSVLPNRYALLSKGGR